MDAARALGIETGGWCPRGRRAEDGAIPAHYPLRETPTRDYRIRTGRNVRDADVILILSRGAVVGGTALTARLARKCAKPCLIVDLDDSHDARSIAAWLRRQGARVVNVAGPRASECPGVHAQAETLLRQVFERLMAREPEKASD